MVQRQFSGEKTVCLTNADEQLNWMFIWKKEEREKEKGREKERKEGRNEGRKSTAFHIINKNSFNLNHEPKYKTSRTKPRRKSLWSWVRQRLLRDMAKSKTHKGKKKFVN